MERKGGERGGRGSKERERERERGGRGKGRKGKGREEGRGREREKRRLTEISQGSTVLSLNSNHLFSFPLRGTLSWEGRGIRDGK